LLSSFRDYLINRGAKQQSNFILCPIHRQERGDYQESWQPALISDKDLYEAQDMAEKSYRGTWWCWTF
jgi:formate-dependent phosphoribosylglycinamide formyltransferase (GAR transformylase)